ncbi:MAG TPA: hypothetical protein VJ960_06155 [Oceanipulchritudo sp.]|nr:hypothetical protein [Oceanipulchritudo sp.]
MDSSPGGRRQDEGTVYTDGKPPAEFARGSGTVIGGASGNISHLLFGESTIYHTGPGQYWMRSSVLGWLYIYADWMPWMHRQADDHWLWLDLAGWPPRAWDEDAQEWLQLR